MCESMCERRVYIRDAAGVRCECACGVRTGCEGTCAACAWHIRDVVGALRVRVLAFARAAKFAWCVPIIHVKPRDLVVVDKERRQKPEAREHVRRVQQLRRVLERTVYARAPRERRAAGCDRSARRPRRAGRGRGRAVGAAGVAGFAKASGAWPWPEQPEQSEQPEQQLGLPRRPERPWPLGTSAERWSETRVCAAAQAADLHDELEKAQWAQVHVQLLLQPTATHHGPRTQHMSERMRDRDTTALDHSS
jgi:hypothetical protein